jgi:hypothetical protein
MMCDRVGFGFKETAGRNFIYLFYSLFTHTKSVQQGQSYYTLTLIAQVKNFFEVIGLFILFMSVLDIYNSFAFM